jgi:hypothetical protein
MTESTADGTAGASNARAASTVPRSLGMESKAEAQAMSAPDARAEGP